MAFENGSLSPSEQYAADLASGKLAADSAQQQVVEALQELYTVLSQRSQGIADWLGINTGGQIKGLYVWGGVGRGKTYFMDCFYASLPVAHKLRIHFHHFMQRIHAELKALSDLADPLSEVARQMAKTTKIICLDELHVTDITDAMLLSGLLNELLRQRVVIVATANEPPDRLYWNGLQRAKFLPAIALIKAHHQVLPIGGGPDYRLQFLRQSEIYHYPLDAMAEATLHSHTQHIEPIADGKELNIQGRSVPCCFVAQDLVWFEFSDLCRGARSVVDYIEIANLFKIVLLANIPVMGDDDNDAAKRFMHLIDEFYDRRVKLIATAVAPPDKLYCGNRLAKQFQRTVSRLEEMASDAYLMAEHSQEKHIHQA